MRFPLIPAFLITASTIASAAQRPVPLTSANQPEFAETEVGCADGRIQDYILRHSDRGIIDPFVMLELSRDIQRTLEADRHRKSPLAIGGDVWNSIGPANGAGRATAIAADPTVAGSLIVGAAGGGAWKTTDGGGTWTPLTETIPNLSVGAIAVAPSSTSTVYLGTGEGGYAGDFVPGIGLLVSTDGGANWTLPDTVIASEVYKISVHPTSPLELVMGTNAGAKRSTNGQNGPWQTVIRLSQPDVDHEEVQAILRDVLSRLPELTLEIISGELLFA